MNNNAFIAAMSTLHIILEKVEQLETKPIWSYESDEDEAFGGPQVRKEYVTKEEVIELVTQEIQKIRGMD